MLGHRGWGIPLTVLQPSNAVDGRQGEPIGDGEKGAAGLSSF